MEKEFLPYNLALELKELGFFEECLGFYIWQSWNNNSRLEIGNDGEYTCETIKAPLWQQAFRFFIEKYMLSGEIYIFKNIWNFDIEDISNSIQLYTSDIMCYNSYEEAEVECLIKLIEIAKEQNVK